MKVICFKFWVMSEANFSMSTTGAVPTESIPNNNNNKYIGADELCVPETRVKYCNLHNPARLCICYSPAELMRTDMPFCSTHLELTTLEHLVLTISLAFPVPQSFQLDPDSIFVEDLELFAGFQRNSVFIVRKGCAPGKGAFQFQFGILRPESLDKPAPLSGRRDLRPIWPQLFTANSNFMRQRGLLVESVTQSRFLRPLLGYSEWIYADEEAERRGLGFCTGQDPLVDCYPWEAALLFVASLYAGAELTCWLLWRLLWWRHGRNQEEDNGKSCEEDLGEEVQQGRRRRRRQRDGREGRGGPERRREGESVELLELTVEVGQPAAEIGPLPFQQPPQPAAAAQTAAAEAVVETVVVVVEATVEAEAED